MRIAVDAMGGDNAPREIVRGVVDAAAGLDNVDKLILVGDEGMIKAEIEAYTGARLPKAKRLRAGLPKIEILHTTQVIEMASTRPRPSA